MDLVALVVAQDAGTAALGALNAGYFAPYVWRPNGRRGRRTAAAALVLLSIAAVVEAAFSQGLFWSQRGTLTLGSLSAGEWAALRLPLFLATVVLAAIVVRRIVGDR